MNHRLFIAFCLLYCSHAPAQSKLTLSTLSATTIRLDSQNPLSQEKDNSLFSHFEVIDQRPDTVRIGIHTDKAAFGHPRDRQLVFNRPAAAELSDWLNRHYARPGAPYTALIVLRTLWLSDASYVHEDLVRNPQKQQERTHIRLKAEVYAGKDSLFMPIFRFDTLQYTIKSVYSVRSPYSKWDRDLAVLLGELADSASFIAHQKQDRSRQIPLEDIHQFNQARFESPINGDTTSLTRGVYVSFEEFRNNAPSIRNFEIKREGNHRLLYIIEAGGKSYYSHDAWGYCDGKNVFIMREGILRIAWREGKAFYYPGNTSGEGQYAQRNANGVYTIDMDTGAVY